MCHCGTESQSGIYNLERNHVKPWKKKKSCCYLSFVLLGSSLLYEVFHIHYIDMAGALGIAFFAFREGREAFEKAKSRGLSCSCSSCGRVSPIKKDNNQRP